MKELEKAIKAIDNQVDVLSKPKLTNVDGDLAIQIAHTLCELSKTQLSLVMGLKELRKPE